MDAELSAAVDQFLAATGEVLTNANRSQFGTSLRKLYAARETLRQKTEELNTKLEAARQRLQLAEAERVAAAEAARRAAEQQQQLAGASTPALDLDSEPEPPLQPIPSFPDDLPALDLKDFGFGSNSMDIDFKF